MLHGLAYKGASTEVLGNFPGAQQCRVHHRYTNCDAYYGFILRARKGCVIVLILFTDQRGGDSYTGGIVNRTQDFLHKDRHILRPVFTQTQAFTLHQLNLFCNY